MKELSLYIHIPFCRSKCYYCDFVSMTTDKYIDTYMDALCKEVDLLSANYEEYTIKTVFIGGGTPTIVDIDKINRLMNKLKDAFDIDLRAEITIESNPGTIDYEYLVGLRRLGINRLSIGLQSANDKLLSKIGRIHDYSTFKRNFRKARDAGFDNINIDLMFGIPNQTMDDIVDTLDKVTELDPEHISFYSLKFEEGTPYYKMLINREIEELEDELDREMYSYINYRLKSVGYIQYEISNYSKLGYRCNHNLSYWKNEEFLGMGLNSSYYFGKKRVKNTSDIEKYIDMVSVGELPIDNVEENDIADEIFETIFLGLRLNDGLDIKSFNKRYDVDFMNIYKKTVEKLMGESLLVFEDDHLKLTNTGRDVSNSVFVEFLD